MGSVNSRAQTMAWLHEKETQNKLSEIMSRLSETEKLALKTLQRVKTRICDLRDNSINNNLSRGFHCLDSDSEESDPSVKEDNFIEQVAEAQKRTSGEDTGWCIMQSRRSGSQKQTRSSSSISQEQTQSSSSNKLSRIPSSKKQSHSSNLLIQSQSTGSQKQSTEDSSSLKSQSRNELLTKQLEPMDISKTWDLVAYHMERVSFHCDSFVNSLTNEQMSTADKLHCQRFHNPQRNLLSSHNRGSGDKTKYQTCVDGKFKCK